MNGPRNLPFDATFAFTPKTNAQISPSFLRFVRWHVYAGFIVAEKSCDMFPKWAGDMVKWSGP